MLQKDYNKNKAGYDEVLNVCLKYYLCAMSVKYVEIIREGQDVVRLSRNREISGSDEGPGGGRS